jgi:competence protein ComEA
VLQLWLAARHASLDARLEALRAVLQSRLDELIAWWRQRRDAHASSPVKRYLTAHHAMVTRWFEWQPLAGVTRWIDARRESSKGLVRALWSGVRQIRYALPTLAAVALVIFAMGGRWRIAAATPPTQDDLASSQMPTVPVVPTTPSTSAASPATSVIPTTSASSPKAPTSPPVTAAMFGGARPWKKPAIALTGKLNLNSATEEQLLMLPTVGPAKAERIIKWRTMNGGFRRIADIRRVKGFGYKTFKRLEAFLDVSGETTLH